MRDTEASSYKCKLLVSLEKASKIEGVELAFPNGAIFPEAVVEGKSCSPLNDPLYTVGSNSLPYEMIGLENAWKIIKASGVKLNKVRAGIIDTAIYTKSDQGFSPELYFPDKNGKYPKGKVQILPLNANKDLTSVAETNPQTRGLINGGLSHGTQMAHIIGADHSGTGAAGVTSIVGENLSIVVTNTFKVSNDISTPAQNIDPNDITQYQGNTYSLLVDLKKQVENNVKVINLSLGFTEISTGNATACQAYKLFFEKMNRDYPDVAFVATVGTAGTDIRIETFGEGFLEGSTTQKINVPGQVSWKLTKESYNYMISVVRSDTEACAFLNLEGDSKLIHGVVPVKVTATMRGETMNGTFYFSYEFWNVGKLGGAKYSAVTCTSYFSENNSTSVSEGYFTGGPNGDIYIEGSTGQIRLKLNGGSMITNAGGDSFPIDNPEAFNGWKD